MLEDLRLAAVNENEGSPCVAYVKRLVVLVEDEDTAA
jgi:hypothetical protein